jgi:uncharacterized protein (TIGR02118 family)
MIKRCVFVQAPTSLQREQFTDLWRGRHATLAKQLPGLVRYTINLVPEEATASVGWDGFAELWFEDVEAMDAAMSSDAGRRLAEDSEATFGKRVAVAVTEAVLLASEPNHGEANSGRQDSP